MENLETAFLLMVVGMATVFVILLIVIYLGKLLISISMLPRRLYLPNRFLRKVLYLFLGISWLQLLRLLMS